LRHHRFQYAGSFQYSSLCESQTILFDFMVHVMVVIFAAPL
jgi:hypothetical protein